jgi:hypothetical protein
MAESLILNGPGVCRGRSRSTLETGRYRWVLALSDVVPPAFGLIVVSVPTPADGLGALVVS